ncbi:hypothetical protein [Variovorax paradoxus]|uniref:hypothetical protein n=1 Tax=Variovorax paradoxus TaxID=34073 RepID=UPI0030CAAB7E
MLATAPDSTATFFTWIGMPREGLVVALTLTQRSFSYSKLTAVGLGCCRGWSCPWPR